MGNIVVDSGKKIIKDKIERTIINPLDKATDHPLELIATTIGTFVTRWIEGKFQRTITFSVGQNYSDGWMEEALYGILYQYNDIKKSKNLNITNKKGMNAGSAMYYRLGDGPHNLKYRNYDIVLHIHTDNSTSVTGRVSTITEYTVITMNLSKDFVTQFERDMILHRNSLLKIKSDSPVVNVFQDYHEGDGYTYWDQINTVNKRKLATVYLPYQQKKLLVDTINTFFASKGYYKEHGIPHNLKILLYGPAGPQPMNTMIPTPDGLKELGAINPGDKVFTINGDITEVVETYDYADLDSWEITFHDGRRAICGGDHNWPVLLKDGKIVKRTTEDIYKRFEEDPDYRYEVPGTGPVKFSHKDIGNNNPYIMGRKIATNNDEIPDNIMYNDIEVRKAFVKGVMRTAGYIHSVLHFKDAIVYTFMYRSVSEHFLDQFRFLLNSLGYPATIGENELTINVVDNQVTNISSPDDIVLLNPSPVLINSVRPLGYKEAMRCLHIDDLLHMYLTNDYLPTFNSGKDSIAKMIASEWNRNIYYVTGGKNGNFIPNAISDNGDSTNYPLFLISDMDKYPYLINETDLDLQKKEDGMGIKEDNMRYKQLFGNMINALDGIMSGEDKIIVITTNHIEKFSDVFLRPGRIDLKMEIGYVVPEVFREYVKKFYNVDLPEDIKLKRKDITVAQMQADVVFMKLTPEEFLAKYLK